MTTEPDGYASRADLIARIEHDALMIERVCAQRDDAQRELAETRRKYVDLLLAVARSQDDVS